MKTLARTSKAMMFVLIAMLLCAVMAFTACNSDEPKDDESGGKGDERQVYRYLLKRGIERNRGGRVVKSGSKKSARFLYVLRQANH